ncbi:MAG TPA: iron-containing alcohol dehydrogenase [bacterium]|nr:iron-containing alcohol dehydrogenase [bacterium]
MGSAMIYHFDDAANHPQRKPAVKFDWNLPTRIIFGRGALARLHEVAPGLGKRALVVLGAASMAQAGVKGRVSELLAGLELSWHEGVRPNLPLEDCDALVRAARESGAELVIGIGGGSVLDGAKAAALMAPGTGWTRDYLDGAGAGPSLPFIAVPATAGTGSEVTPSMIVLDPERGRKVGLSRPEALARAAIVDPELTLTLPPDQTAATGLDALSHAFEAYWSKLANPVSDALALDALYTVMQHLERAYQYPDDLDAREGMSYGALAAGMAISHTATAALHGLTYPMTAHFGVPHGMACAFLMREILTVNFHHLDCQKQKRLLHAMKSNTLQAALDLLGDLYAELKVPETLDDLKIPEDQIKTFVDEATPANLHRNIAPLNRKKIMELWAKKRG